MDTSHDFLPIVRDFAMRYDILLSHTQMSVVATLARIQLRDVS
jgi:hypothetical protein